MKKIILSLMFVLFASMAIASVSAVHAEDGWVSLDDAEFNLDELSSEGYMVTCDDYKWLEIISENGFVREDDLDYLIWDIKDREKWF